MSVHRNGVLAGGNFITDYVKVIEAWPEQDTLVSIHSQSMSNGGGPYNILKNLAVMAPGLPLEACGLVGEDTNGDWVVADCEAAGINITQLHRTGKSATSYTDAMTVTSTGRRTFFHQRGANALLTPEHFDFTKTSTKIFSLGFLMLLDSLDTLDEAGMSGAARVLQAARRAGMITAVDCVSVPGPQFRELALSALAEADILFLNEFEIGQIIGRQVLPEPAAMQEAARELAAQAAREDTRIVLHATSGAVVAKRSGALVTQASVALPDTKIAGATGAGDAFASGFLLGVHEDLDDDQCLRQAVCAAAMSLRDPTPSGGMRAVSECLDLGELHGFRDF